MCLCKQFAAMVTHARAKEQNVLIVSTVQQGCCNLDTDEPMHQPFFVMLAVILAFTHVCEPLFHVVVKWVVVT